MPSVALHFSNFKHKKSKFIQQRKIVINLYLLLPDWTMFSAQLLFYDRIFFIIFLYIFHINWKTAICHPMASSYSENLTIPDFLVQLMNLPNPPVAAPNGNGISFGHQQEKTHKMGKNEEEANDEEGEREEEEENRTGGKFQQRAICPYQFVLNHRPNRVPRTLVEVKCLSDRPSKRISFDQQIECRPMHWTLRVLYCKKGEKERNEDEEEDEEEEEEENGVVAEEEVNKNNKRRNNYQCRHAKERISLACLPMLAVAKRQKNAIENEDDDDGMVPVPAKPFDDPLEGT